MQLIIPITNYLITECMSLLSSSSKHAKTQKHVKFQEIPEANSTKNAAKRAEGNQESTKCYFIWFIRYIRFQLQEHKKKKQLLNVFITSDTLKGCCYQERGRGFCSQPKVYFKFNASIIKQVTTFRTKCRGCTNNYYSTPPSRQVLKLSIWQQQVVNGKCHKQEILTESMNILVSTQQ